MNLKLQYRTLYQFISAQEKMKRLPWARHNDDQEKSNRMLLWTLGPEATKESKENFDHCMELAQWAKAQYVVIHQNKLQFLGHNLCDDLNKVLRDRAWTKSYTDWLNHYSVGPSIDTDSSGISHCTHFSIYRSCLALKEQMGIWHVASRQRLTNRQQIIETIWDHGFATWRGRPYSVARLKWTGNKDDLTDATALYDKYVARYKTSNVAKKIVSAFTSINRYAAWPGAW